MTSSSMCNVPNRSVSNIICCQASQLAPFHTSICKWLNGYVQPIFYDGSNRNTFVHVAQAITVPCHLANSFQRAATGLLMHRSSQLIAGFVDVCFVTRHIGMFAYRRYVIVNTHCFCSPHVSEEIQRELAA